MMSDRIWFVTSAYGISAIVLTGLIFLIFVQRRAARKDLATLEASGIKRRSDE